MYRVLITLSLILVFGSSAIMSISGLLSIFSKNTLIIICMGVGMESGKILTISHLYRTWQKNNTLAKTGYIFIVFILTLLTSFEVIGFLSQSHQKTIWANDVIQSEIAVLNDEELILKNQVNIINETLKGLPQSHVTRRIKERKNSDYAGKQNRLIEIVKQKSSLEIQLISKDGNLNPIFSIAKILKVKESNIISIFIPFLVLILEPLLIGLTIATNAAWLNNNKERKKEPSKANSTANKNLIEELKVLQKQHNLSLKDIAKISGRKKLQTCEGWLNGTIPTPPRVLKKIKVWVKKQGVSSQPIRLIQAGGIK